MCIHIKWVASYARLSAKGGKIDLAFVTGAEKSPGSRRETSEAFPVAARWVMTLYALAWHKSA